MVSCRNVGAVGYDNSAPSLDQRTQGGDGGGGGGGAASAEDAVALARKALNALLLPVIEVSSCQSLFSHDPVSARQLTHSPTTRPPTKPTCQKRRRKKGRQAHRQAGRKDKQNGKTAKREKERKTHVIFLLHVHLARRPPHAKLLRIGHLPDLAVVPLVADGRRGREDKGTRDDDGHEGQPERQERVLVHERAVAHAEAPGVARAAELVALKRRHRCGGPHGTERRNDGDGDGDGGRAVRW